jgi:hypothetical protein
VQAVNASNCAGLILLDFEAGNEEIRLENQE